MKHMNVALFVPHEGCPRQCSFCNQRSISGKSLRLTDNDVDLAVKTAYGYKATAAGFKREIAFFGGSFTAIDRGYMIDLLEAASKYIDGKHFTGIRISTRPDAVNREICDILKHYGVTAIELGAQSMDDNVLMLNRRGHTAKNVVDASALIADCGFELGLQMMTGLYDSSNEESMATAKKIVSLKPKTVRIYPTVVLQGTHLAELLAAGEYKTQSLDEAVFLCAELLELFFHEGIEVIRLGLHSGGNVEDDYIAGPYHPAFRELCESEIYLQKARLALTKAKIEDGAIMLFVAENAISQMIGQKRANLAALKAEGYDCKVMPSSGLNKYQVSVEQADSSE